MDAGLDRSQMQRSRQFPQAVGRRSALGQHTVRGCNLRSAGRDSDPKKLVSNIRSDRM
jgi:hypothetical protein